MRRIRTAPVLFCTALAADLAVAAGAQSKQPPSPADYGQWETLTAQPRGGLSPDGRWLMYGINRSNRENELRITNVADGTTRPAAFGSQPVFSADSKWIAYAVGYSDAQEEKLRKQKKPVQRKLGVLKLTTGPMTPDKLTTIEGVESFAFNAAGTHLALRRYPIERKDPPAGAPVPAPAPADDGSPAPGATLIVRELATGRDTTFGNVAEFAWQDKGPLLAFTINADEKIGNGVHLFDPSTSALRVLDSAAAGYVGLSWRKDADDLVVLRATTDERHDGATHTVIAWTPVSAAEPVRHIYEPSADRRFPAGMRTVAFRKPSWSDDGDIVFLGLARWNDKPAKDKARKDDTTETADDEEEPAAVDVWHARDVEVIPRQKISAANDRRRNMLAAWHVSTGSFVPLGKDLFEQVTSIKRQKLAYVASWPAYAMNRSIGRAAADLALVDLTTGTRTKLIDRIDDGYVQASPDGRYLLFLNADHFWTIDTRTQAITNITKTVQRSFVNRESDATIRQKPAFGVAGWTKDDEAVILYDKFDVWQVASDGSRATRLTDGAAEQVRHRYVRVNPDDEWIDVEKPVALSLFGTWTKRSGYGWLNAASRSVERGVWLDKSVTGLGRAKGGGRVLLPRAILRGFPRHLRRGHTDIFAAGIAGAPITDLVSNYGNHHWSSGIAETDHIETGQQRMEVPLYEDLAAYIRNSAVFNVQNMKTPLLVEVGDGDGTVFWRQGIELYNIARRAKKDVVLLAYAGEDHGLRKKANQIDYQHRILQWFGHYLRNEPAPGWITSGVSVLEREQELKRASKKGS